MSNTHHLPIAQVNPNPNQPRKQFKKQSLLELAQSIKENGLVQPVIVEPTDDGNYMLVAGERRWRASQMAGMDTIEAIIRERSNHNGRELLVKSVIENVQREDMNPMDEAEAIFTLKTVHKMSVGDIAQKLGIVQKRVYDALDRLKLHKKVQDMIRNDQLSHDTRLVLALLKLPKQEMQVELAERAIKHKLKITTIVTLAAQWTAAVESKPLSKNKSKVPSLSLAMHTDEEKQPPKWNALMELGKVPAWPLVANAARATCAECELRDMANHATCGRCPLVIVLEKMLESAK